MIVPFKGFSNLKLSAKFSALHAPLDNRVKKEKTVNSLNCNKVLFFYSLTSLSTPILEYY